MKAMTGRILLRLSVLSLTFLIGCLVQFSFHRPGVHHRKASCQRQKSHLATAPPGWRKIVIGRVSFYVPAEMKPIGKQENDGGVIEVLRYADDDYLYLYYAHGPEIHTVLNVIPSQTLQGKVGDKPASINQWERPKGAWWNSLDQSGVQVVIKDAGDGNKFELYASSDNSTLVQKVIDTIEIH